MYNPAPAPPRRSNLHWLLLLLPVLSCGMLTFAPFVVLGALSEQRAAQRKWFAWAAGWFAFFLVIVILVFASALAADVAESTTALDGITAFLIFVGFVAAIACTVWACATFQSDRTVEDSRNRRLTGTDYYQSVAEIPFPNQSSLGTSPSTLGFYYGFDYPVDVPDEETPDPPHRRR